MRTHNEHNIELVYNPTYSPDCNPVELVFNKMRTVMRYDIWEVTNKNIELAAIEEAVDYITPNDAVNFFQAYIVH